jgi:hypothetical protein
MGIGTLVAVVFGLGAAAVAWRRTMIARGHRDVGGFALGAAVTVALLATTASFVVAPGLWASLYRLVIGVYDNQG